MRLIFLVSLFTLFIWSCSEEVEPQKKKDPKWTKEQSIEMQTTFSNEEEEEIESFLNRHPDWKMTETGTGLRYFVYQKSENQDSAKVGDIVIVDFNISLLDGTECYSSEEKGPENFMVERTDIESGLHEAMKLMCTGDRAKFILPSHLAHGLIGDLDKIPPLVSVIYDIHLLEIKKYEK
ncbi:MAG: FKBP-type peptidyl-prolyl cis-trans isomerase [Putridiphycobacter sp.]